MKGNGKRKWVVGGARPGLGAGWKRGYILPLCISMSSFLWYALQSHITSRACSLFLSLYTLSTNLSLFNFVPSISYVFSLSCPFAVSSSCFGLLLDTVGACYRVVVVPLPHPPAQPPKLLGPPNFQWPISFATSVCNYQKTGGEICGCMYVLEEEVEEGVSFEEFPSPTPPSEF